MLGKPDFSFWNAIISVLAILSSLGCSYWLGGLAGQKAAQEFEEEKAAKARLTALKSLINEVGVIRKLAQSNTKKDKTWPRFRGSAQMPVTAFETAFVSGKSGIEAEQSTIDAVTGYLSQAHHINALIDLYFGLATATGGLQQNHTKHALLRIEDTCTALTPILDQLGSCLQKELDHSDA